MFRPGNKVGQIGEGIAVKFLMKQGFRVRSRNFWKKGGEIDIIAEKEGVIHFIEVKSVSRENIEIISLSQDVYRPEDNIHLKKIKNISATAQLYLLEQGIVDAEWCIDACIVYIDLLKKRAKVKMIRNIFV